MKIIIMMRSLNNFLSLGIGEFMPGDLNRTNASGIFE